ncbi:MAG: hypothetical protein WAW75_10115 [Gallionella sp.]
MVRRLCRGGIEVAGYNQTAEVVGQLAAEECILVSASVVDAVSKLSSPRVAWLILPRSTYRLFDLEDQFWRHSLNLDVAHFLAY